MTTAIKPKAFLDNSSYSSNVLVTVHVIPHEHPGMCVKECTNRSWRLCYVMCSLATRTLAVHCKHYNFYSRIVTR